MSERCVKKPAGLQVVEIPIDLLDDHPDNEKIFNISRESLEELAVSIRAIGVRQPLEVEEKDGGRYVVAAGHRRKYAAKMAGLAIVPCIIKRDEIDTGTILVETNLRTRELSVMEKAKAVRYEKNRLNMRRGRPRSNSDTVSELEKLFNKSFRNLNRYDRLNDLIPEFQKLVETGEIGLVLGSRLAGLEPGVQKELYEFLGEAVKDIGPEDIKRLREQNDRGYLVLEVMQRKLKELEGELEKRREKEGDIADLERRIQALRNKKRSLEYDLADYANAAVRSRKEVLNSGAALLAVAEELARPIAGAKPKIAALLETPIETNTATHLVKWSQVLLEVGQMIEAAAKKALVVQGGRIEEPKAPGGARGSKNADRNIKRRDANA